MSVWRKAAVVVASVAALTSLGSAAANAERGPDGRLYGAIAVSTLNNDDSWGAAWNYPNQGEANGGALDECGRSCKVLVEFNEGCGSVAQSEDGARFYGGYGSTPAAAEQMALTSLAGIKPQLPFPFTGSSQPERGTILVTKCTDGY
ncbi:DUF4189 domain-containing protein [Nocardia sp. NPDC127526]|uniref:DUF4189 domain-containing protein n=1 Tax=Nocardia sp. NPDC127526 TaxID=3345393 RepID=UPI00362E93B1